MKSKLRSLFGAKVEETPKKAIKKSIPIITNEDFYQVVNGIMLKLESTKLYESTIDTQIDVSGTLDALPNGLQAINYEELAKKIKFNDTLFYDNEVFRPIEGLIPNTILNNYLVLQEGNLLFRIQTCDFEYGQEKLGWTSQYLVQDLDSDYNGLLDYRTIDNKTPNLSLNGDKPSHMIAVMHDNLDSLLATKNVQNLSLRKET